jgi:AraC-like DNA-binding protein
MIATKVWELILQTDRFIANAESEPNEDSQNGLVASFNGLIEKNIKTERSVQFYADALHLHPNHLNYLIKRHTGTTAKHTIIDHIFLESKHLLDSTSLTIKEITYELGFASPASFSSFFKKMSNISPSKYRNDFL